MRWRLLISHNACLGQAFLPFSGSHLFGLLKKSEQVKQERGKGDTGKKNRKGK
jgi:hypothetical protein